MLTKTYTVDLGGSPWGEDCAQIGHTPNFDCVNAAEVTLYRAALIARYGQPPKGLTISPKANDHDFGRYHTLEAEVQRPDDPIVNAYLEQIEKGIERWFHAGFAPPDYSVLRDSNDVIGFITRSIEGAINTTRPMSDGSFFPPDFENLHNNLKTAFQPGKASNG